ncbi:hypothetical protein D1632_15400 [Chryseobacterium nematophagum]|uniref:DUF695 domain-containing protein n=1 Tax=Chryseobacterium nematophagum TaxID=2305228 RepID=A0A3M7LAE1_9FLAO|nr:hypothetical protein [Chryseobacterium nematophagum]RMZ58950.1 hypothetical protein D1632_15400 [Chryseobacterium nematophagum]
MNTYRISEFWNWFEFNQSELVPDKITDTLINELNNKILSLADLNWEIREGINKSNMLIISAGGNNDLLSIAKNIIDCAPNLKEWEYSYYKPAKKWDYRLSLKKHIGFDKEINVENWEYVLERFDDTTFGIIIKTENINTLKDDDKYTIVDIVLENILGDDLSYGLIKNVEIVNEFDDNQIKNKSIIKYLANHLLEQI